MNTSFSNLIRKWGVGLCLVLWWGAGLIAMFAPVGLFMMLMLPSVLTFLLIIPYCALAVPLMAYRWGSAFGLPWEKPAKESMP